MPFHGWLRGIGVVLKISTERQLCVKDWLLSGSGGASAFCDELILGSGMIYFRQLLLVRSKMFRDPGCTLRKEITSNDAKVGKELAGLGIGQNEIE